MTDQRWHMVELWGETHLRLAIRSHVTACEARLNPYIDVTPITNISNNITCTDCLRFARELHIPTSHAVDVDAHAQRGRAAYERTRGPRAQVAEAAARLVRREDV